MNLLMLPEPKERQIKRQISCFIVPGLHLLIDEAITLSCHVCGIDKSQIKKKTRKREYAYARYIIMKILKDYTIMSHQHIGGVVFDLSEGHRDLNATVIHGIGEIENAIWLAEYIAKNVLYDLYIQVERVFNEKYKKELLSPQERVYQRLTHANR